MASRISPEYTAITLLFGTANPGDVTWLSGIWVLSWIGGLASRRHLRSISCDIDGKTVTVEYDDAKTKPQERSHVATFGVAFSTHILQDMWDKMKKWADAAQKELAPCPA